MIPRPDSPAQAGSIERDPTRDPLAWAGMLGKRVIFEWDGWHIEATVTDVRAVYGRVLVELAQGPGRHPAGVSRWVSAARVIQEVTS